MVQYSPLNLCGGGVSARMNLLFIIFTRARNWTYRLFLWFWWGFMFFMLKNVSKRRFNRSFKAIAMDCEVDRSIIFDDSESRFGIISLQYRHNVQSLACSFYNWWFSFIKLANHLTFARGALLLPSALSRRFLCLTFLRSQISSVH